MRNPRIPRTVELTPELTEVGVTAEEIIALCKADRAAWKNLSHRRKVEMRKRGEPF